jgi:hypothetical protein
MIARFTRACDEAPRENPPRNAFRRIPLELIGASFQFRDHLGIEPVIHIEGLRCQLVPATGIFQNADPETINQCQAFFDAQGLRIEISRSHGAILVVSLWNGQPPSVEPDLRLLHRRLEGCSGALV